MSNQHAEGLGTYLSASQITSAFGICRSGIFTLMSRGEFPAGVKIGRCRRWALSDVQAWLDGKKQEGGIHIAD